MSYLHCKIQYGVAHVLGVFESIVHADDIVSFSTGDITLPGNLPDEPWAYTGTQTEGSIDGTVEQDFKTPKALNIMKRSSQLLSGGVFHDGREFAASGALVELALNMDIAVDPFIKDLAELYYEVPSLGSLTLFKSELKDRRIAVLDATLSSGGEGDLINDVTSAANTKVAMDAIVDSRS